MGQANAQIRKSSRKRCVGPTLAAAFGVSRTPGLAEFWFRSQEEVYGLLYHAVKAINPKAQVGWHIMHLVTLSPFYQADQEFGRIVKTADFLKPCAYNNCAGPRFARYIRNVHSTVFRDLAPDEVLVLHYRLLGYEHEASLDKLPTTGMSAQYVARETRRALAEVNGAVPIYPGIDQPVSASASFQAWGKQTDSTKKSAIWVFSRFNSRLMRASSVYACRFLR